MKSNGLVLIMVACALTSVNSMGGGPKEKSGLRIHLLREVAVDNAVPRLGQVSIIRGSEPTAARAGNIVLGRISAPGQKIVVDRLVLLGRLASNGISASEVKLTGAQQTAISRKHRTVEGAQLVDFARSYLLKNSAAGSACRLDVLKTPQDMVLDRTGDRVELAPRLIKSSTPNQARVAIAVFAGGKEVGTREVSFRLKYKSRRAVALVAIPAGGVIGPNNVRMEEVMASYPESPDRVVTYGMVARRAIAANTVLRRTLVGPVEPPLALKRNQNVLIRIETFGLIVTAAGKTLQEGRTGECIRVRNVDSQRIIMAKINNDGTVEPVY